MKSFCGNNQLMTRHGGFSLVELLVTIAILVILSAVAVPGFQGMMASSSLRAATNDVVAALAQTRSLAIKEGGRVTMCKSANGTACATTGDWEQGWIIFVDSVRNSPWTNASVDTGETVSFYTQALQGNVVVRGNSGASQYVSYSADGLSRQLNGSSLAAATIRVCSTSSAIADNQRARDIAINSTGRVTVTTAASVTSACAAPS
ncbi:GspH/FimT family pseudopilin [Curvibacter sp. APW13]|uniref:GspH/FimT family pseudopilin n=1 Tax=Curvibacter sp. APW13 TaxID=3077236 RepID=UPI0028DF6008|nr:GspH/FimT family pseudopilin [Curvibacter sp. APW13]MDT8991414.1 GspH/FimT family pseudopilin [Curvibacter sp. APW13]